MGWLQRSSYLHSLRFELTNGFVLNIYFQGEYYYNAYEKDIAVVNIYFGKPTVFGRFLSQSLFIQKFGGNGWHAIQLHSIVDSPFQSFTENFFVLFRV